MSKHKNKSKKRSISNKKTLLIIVLSLALIAAIYFAYNSFLRSNNWRKVSIASGISEDSKGNKRDTEITITSGSGTTVREGEESAYKNSVRDGDESDLEFTGEEVQFSKAEEKQVKVCVVGRDWRPFGDDGIVNVSVTAGKENRIPFSLNLDSSVGKVIGKSSGSAPSINCKNNS